MAINPKLLNEGERIVVDTRTHPKVLMAPFLVLLLVAFVTAYVAGKIDSWVDDPDTQRILWVVVGLLVLGVLVVWVVRPFISWLTSTYTFTDRRFIQRSGFVSKEGRTIPLNRISGVDFEMGLVDRLFKCGTLVVSDASEQGRVELTDIPDVERVQMRVAEELHRLSSPEHRGDDGT